MQKSILRSPIHQNKINKESIQYKKIKSMKNSTNFHKYQDTATSVPTKSAVLHHHHHKTNYVFLPDPDENNPEDIITSHLQEN